MAVAFAVTGASALLMMAGAFWALSRLGVLQETEVWARHLWRITIGGEAEVSVVDWVVWMRRREWSGPALPMLLGFLGLLGMLYGTAAIAVLAFRRGGFGFAPTVAVGAVLAYVMFNLIRMFIRADARAKRILASEGRQANGE